MGINAFQRTARYGAVFQDTVSLTATTFNVKDPRRNIAKIELLAYSVNLGQSIQSRISHGLSR